MPISRTARCANVNSPPARAQHRLHETALGAAVFRGDPSRVASTTTRSVSSSVCFTKQKVDHARVDPPRTQRWPLDRLRWSLYVMNADGSEPRRIPLPVPAYNRTGSHPRRYSEIQRGLPTASARGAGWQQGGNETGRDHTRPGESFATAIPLTSGDFSDRPRPTETAAFNS